MDQKTLKSLLTYDPKTGVFRWREWKVGCRRNLIAGHTDGPGYVKICINQSKPLKAHRLAWLYVHGEWPDNIDHINRDPSDNRLVNLRNVTHVENMRNHSLHRDNQTGISGVGWDKARGQWYVAIGRQPRRRKRVDNLLDAIALRKTLEMELGYL